MCIVNYFYFQEDFLATDELFVEYFNVFLGLPVRLLYLVQAIVRCNWLSRLLNCHIHLAKFLMLPVVFSIYLRNDCLKFFQTWHLS